MKKTLVAAGIIVALGVIWTGGAWYTGKQFENRIADMVRQANEQLARNAPQAGLQMSYEQYQRGLFSSRLRMVIAPLAGKTDGWLKPGQRVELDERIDHGPFPLASLKTLNLLPAMASVRTTLIDNEFSKPWFAIGKGQSPFEANTRIGYGGDARSVIDLQPLDYQRDGERASFSGGRFTFDADRNADVITLSGEAKSGLIDAVNEYNQRVQLTFNDLQTDGTSKRSPFDERLGNQTLKLGKLTVAVEGKEMAVLEGMTFDGKSEPADDGKTINSQFGYTLDSLKLQDQNVGSGKLTIKLGQLDGQGLHQASQQYNAAIQALPPDLEKNSELYQQKIAEAVLDALPLLLKGEPVLTVAPLSWKNAKGESSVDLSLYLKEPAAGSAPPQNLEQQIDGRVKSLDGKLTIPMAMATEFMTQIARLEGYQQDDAAKLADQQVKGLAAMGQMFRLTATRDDNITTSLQYANGQVTLNGQKMPLRDFLGMFGMPDLTPPQEAAPQP